MKSSTTKELREMEFLRSKSLIILDYLIDISGSEDEPINHIYERVSQPVNTYPLAGWQELHRQAEASIKTYRRVPGFSKTELDELLASRFKHIRHAMTIKLMNKILKRGKIKTMEESEAVREFLGKTEDGHELSDRLDELYKLLYEDDNE